jgi:hypothetical protein
VNPVNLILPTVTTTGAPVTLHETATSLKLSLTRPVERKLEWGWGDPKLTDLLAFLQTCQAEFPDVPAAVSFKKDYDGIVDGLTIEFQVPKTDAELETEIAAKTGEADRSRQWQEERERQEWERLKQKYGQ